MKKEKMEAKIANIQRIREGSGERMAILEKVNRGHTIRKRFFHVLLKDVKNDLEGKKSIEILKSDAVGDALLCLRLSNELPPT